MNPEIRIEADMLQAQFRGQQSIYVDLLRGPIMQDLSRRAIRVESAAKRIATGPPPSPPGHGPGVRTGRLRASITWRLGVDEISAYADVGTNVLYGPYVELGTSKMAARPFLRPALEAAR